MVASRIRELAKFPPHKREGAQRRELLQHLERAADTVHDHKLDESDTETLHRLAWAHKLRSSYSEGEESLTALAAQAKDRQHAFDKSRRAATAAQCRSWMRNTMTPRVKYAHKYINSADAQAAEHSQPTLLR